MANSSRQTLQGRLVTAYSAIATEDGYETDVEYVTMYPGKVDEDIDKPWIALEFPEMTREYLDAQRTIYTDQIRVVVWGFFQEEMTTEAQDVYAPEAVGEKLLKDILTITDNLMLRDIADGTMRWNIKLLPNIRVRGPRYEKKNRGSLSVEYTASLRFGSGGA